MKQPAAPTVAPAPGPVPGPSPAQLRRDAQILRRLLERELAAPRTPAATQPVGPSLIVLCGLPGTGKSYFARQLSRRLDLVILETDRLRKTLVPKPVYTPDEHARVFAVSHLLIEEFLTKGRRVLFDATNLTEDARQPLYHISDNLRCPLALVRLTAPVQLVKRRLDRRAAGRSNGDYSDADWQIHLKMRPYQQPIQRRHLIVDSSQDITPALRLVIAQVTPNPQTQ